MKTAYMDKTILKGLTSLTPLSSKAIDNLNASFFPVIQTSLSESGSIQCLIQLTGEGKIGIFELDIELYNRLPTYDQDTKESVVAPRAKRGRPKRVQEELG